MSSPAVEVNCIRTVPLNIEGINRRPMETEEITGYPFDNTDRDIHSQLDDIAKRHPELAEHLGTFRQRANSRPSTADEHEFRTRFTRPFGHSFDHFGFPFDSDDFDSDKYTQFHRPREEFYQPNRANRHQESSRAYEEQPTYQHSEPQYHQAQSKEVPEPQPAQPGPGRSNLQQSNTTDLGQRQEPVNDRNQRSMSAPPVDKGQRFASASIPPQPQQAEKMSQPETKSNERIIPIHIEGRDEPVLPKNVPPSFSQTYIPPQSERIFGQRPEQFTQFLNREPRQFGYAEEPIRQQRYHQQHTTPSQYTQRENITIPVQKTHQGRPQEQQQQQRTASPIPQPTHPQAHPDQPTTQPQQQQQSKPAPQQNKSLSPIEQIQTIQKSVSELMARVEQFNGKPKDKEYLYLDEMLTRNLLKLDNIDTQGQENIRSARKEAVKCIEKTISVLEAKAAANVEPPKSEEKMELVSQEVNNEPKEPEVQNVSEQPMDAQSVGEKEIRQPMEIVPESSADTQQESQNKQTLVSELTIEIGNSEQTGDKQETCEGQESNMCVADAVKKFDGSNQDQSEDKTHNTAAGIEEVRDENIMQNKDAPEAIDNVDSTEKKKIKKKAGKKEK